MDGLKRVIRKEPALLMALVLAALNLAAGAGWVAESQVDVYADAVESAAVVIGGLIVRAGVFSPERHDADQEAARTMRGPGDLDEDEEPEPLDFGADKPDPEEEA